MKQLLLALFIAMNGISFAQQKTKAKKPAPKVTAISLSFVVKNNLGEALDNISVEHGALSFLTDSTGKVRIHGLKKGDTLVFSPKYLEGVYYQDFELKLMTGNVYRTHYFVVAANTTALQEIVLEKVVFVPAEFPDGKAAMYRWISQKLVYPQTALEEMISGTCKIRFKVEKDGSITSLLIVEGVKGCRQCDEEVKRVFRMMPKWTPATIDGESHEFYLIIPVRFVVVD